MASAWLAGVYDISYELRGTSFDDILEQLPSGWEPDVVIWWDLIYQGIPPGIENCPYPTVVIVGDWNLGFWTTCRYVQAFDYILTDRWLFQLLQSQGIQNCSYWPSFSFEPDKHHLIPKLERIYDVSFIGNMNHRVHRKRSHFLERIARLSDRYQILIAGGIRGEPYTRVLNQSKMVFNLSIRGEMNMRAYEAPACGALLLMEYDNLEIRDFLIDRESCVLYTEDNLEALIDYYLTHEKERETIAECGRQAIQKHSYEKQFERLFSFLSEAIVRFQQGKQRTFQLWTELDRKLVVARQLHHANTLGSTPYAFEYLHDSDIFSRTLGGLHQGDYRLLNAMGVLLYDLYYLDVNVEDPESRKQAREGVQQVGFLFKVVLEKQPFHPIASYNLAWVHDTLGEFDKAIRYYQQCLTLLDKDNIHPIDELYGYILPNSYRENFMVEWERNGFEQAADFKQLQAGYHALLKWQVMQRLGHIYFQQQKWEQAEEMYRQARDLRPDFGMTDYFLGQVAIRKGDYAAAMIAYRASFQKQPYMVDYWGDLAWLQIFQTFEFDDAIVFLQDCLRLVNIHNPSLERNKKPLQQLLQLAYIGKASLAGSVVLDGIEHFSPVFYAHLKDLWRRLGVIERAPFYNICAPFKIFYSPSLLEKIPDFPDGSDFIWVSEPEQAHVVIGSQADYQRTYDKPSHLEQHIIGPDLLPIYFPQIPPLPGLEFEGWGDFNFLLIGEHFEQDLLLSLHQFGQIFENQPQVTCLIWNPQRRPNEQELILLSEALSNSAASITVLTEVLSLQEQITLLGRVDRVVGKPEGCIPYYLWWALLLGQPVWFMGEAWAPYPEVDIREMIETEWNSCFQNNQQDKQKAHQIQAQLLNFYKNGAEQRLLDTFWKLKILYHSRD